MANQVLYACAQLYNGVCVAYAPIEQSPSLLDALAIDKQQASALAVAMASLLCVAWILGLIGRFLLKDI